MSTGWVRHENARPADFGCDIVANMKRKRPVILEQIFERTGGRRGREYDMRLVMELLDYQDITCTGEFFQQILDPDGNEQPSYILVRRADVVSEHDAGQDWRDFRYVAAGSLALCQLASDTIPPFAV